jgi:ADP-ribose pyrophosphatase
LRALLKLKKEVPKMMESMDLTEKTLRREDKFEGKIMTVHVDEVLLPNGNTSTREVVDHVDGVAVLPLDERNNVLTVTQYRYVFGRTLLEIPAGKLDPGEDPVTGALRELKEETGAVPDTFLPLGRILPAPGCYGEALYLYLARGLRMEEQHLDLDEFLNVERIPFDEMVHRCMNGEIEDAKTVAAVLKVKLLLNL